MVTRSVSGVAFLPIIRLEQHRFGPLSWVAYMGFGSILLPVTVDFPLGE